MLALVTEAKTSHRLLAFRGRFLSVELAIDKDFGQKCKALCQAVMDVIAEPTRVQEVIEAFPHSVYVKSSTGVVLHSNRMYREMFAGDTSVIGRFSKSFLNDTIKPVSESSDALILAGCTNTLFEHAGRDVDGRSVLCETYKQSLLGLGHSQLAIFGVTKVVHVEDESAQKVLDLARYWQMFQGLDGRDREIAKMLAAGERIKTISKEFDVSEKTIDNRRQVILSQLSLVKPTELTKLLVRLQDNGFYDFGL